MSRMYSYVWSHALIAALLSCGPQTDSIRSSPENVTAEQLKEMLQNQAWEKEALLKISSEEDLAALATEHLADIDLSEEDLAELIKELMAKTPDELASALPKILVDVLETQGMDPAKALGTMASYMGEHTDIFVNGAMDQFIPVMTDYHLPKAAAGTINRSFQFGIGDRVESFRPIIDALAAYGQDDTESNGAPSPEPTVAITTEQPAPAAAAPSITAPVEMIVGPGPGPDTLVRDTDRDGMEDSIDPCPLDSDHTLVTKYQDRDHDGLVIQSREPVCQNDPEYPLVAESLSFFQLENLDPDDTVAEATWAGLGTVLEADFGIDLNRNRDLQDTEPYYVIANPAQWLDFAANCGSDTTTTCSVNVVIVADLDFSVLDGKQSDRIVGDGAYTTSNLDDLVSAPGAAQPYSGWVSSLDRTISNLHIDRDDDNTGWFARAADARFSDFTYHGNINGHHNTAVGLIGRVEGEVHIGNVAYEGSVMGGNAVGGIVGLATGSTEKVWLSGARVRGKVEGADDVGGLLGRSDMAFLTASVYNLADVVATNGDAAGIIGMANGRGSVWVVSNSGAVTATKNAAGIIIGNSTHTSGYWLIGDYNLGRVTSTGDGFTSAGIFVDVTPTGGKYTIRRTYNAGPIAAKADTSSRFGIGEDRAGAPPVSTSGVYFMADDYQNAGIGTAIDRQDMYKAESYPGFNFDGEWTINEGESLPFYTIITPEDETPTLD